MVEHLDDNHDVDTDHAEVPVSDITADAITGAQQPTTTTPRVKGTCSNPDWTPTVYEPYRP
ncbi:hypothetical protein PBI_KRATIO_99 [Mycobacterium phage Kratio]|uniref:Uncharacterized protein n=5 Tax=Kratiovirus TaxID=2948788 RepID=A0A221J7D0_9CAUD|nr:hypothetical protein PBI_KRATIO_99 [Mycobacterium phage Kratio]YP_009950712.1 hypothetical protein I5G72_gp05 [Mycobacterium phage Collard]ASM62605.1 hypothetical protein SEA_ALLEYCAT_99 [Mycobacterium phage AlleyCat]ASR85788.1 hypothetical protein SEA_EDUGATOR_91 [Mycobacterium phage Edugator]QQV92698.1 hypothetical protein SEA_PSYCHO_97 [Mycobacterium phage Psycho]UEM46490.1 hypothetical protein SEA_INVICTUSMANEO_96 [Mycobacterium phage InvictusManeo]WAB09780.1 hypothetical protein SEA_D